MRAFIIGAAALAVFFLGVSMLAAPASAPAVNADRCLLCHPQAHPDQWAQTVHAAELDAGDVPMTECTRCHTSQYCDGCHTQMRVGSTSSPAAETQVPASGAESP